MTRLPEAYQEVEYLRGTGTQYIRTSYFATGNTSTKIKFRVNELQGYGIFGSRDTTTPTNAFLMWGAGAGFWRAQYGNQNFVSEIPRDTAWHVWEQRRNACFLDGKLFNIFNKQDFQNTYEQLLFGIGGSATTLIGLYVGKNDIGIVEYWENDMLTMQLVPCYRKADKVAGYYDTVYGEFLTNAGTGTFEVGPDILYSDDIQLVEYIEVTGNQYIDTGIIGKTDEYKIKTKIRTSNNISGLQSIYGVRKDSGNTRFMVGFYTSSGQIKFDLAINTDNFGLVVHPNTEYELEADYTQATRTLKINGNLSVTSTDTLDTTGNIFLGGYNRMWQPISQMTSFFLGRIYSFEVIDLNGKHILNAKPAYRKSDGKTGIYDEKRKVFLPNLGANEFVVGADVFKPSLRMMYWNSLPEEYQEVEYIESAGASADGTNAHSIDLGFKGNQDTVMTCEVAMMNTPRRVFGDNTTATQAITLYLASSGSEINRFGNNAITGAIRGTLKTGEFQKYKVDKNGIFCDNQQIAEFSAVNFETASNLRFLTINGYPPNVGVLRVKAFGVEGKAKFIPCRRKSDNEAGFFDLVSGEFKTCAGLTAGADVDRKQARFIYISSSQPSGKLPIEYQEVTHIQSDGNQYINTGYTGNLKTEVNYHGKFISATDTFFQVLGNNVTSSRALTVNLNITGNSATTRFGNKSASMSYRVPQNTEFTLKLNKNVYGYKDDKGFLSSLPIDATTAFTTNGVIWLMFTSGGSYRGVSQFVSSTIIQAGAVVRDYRPCYRKSDGVIGVFDMITGTFLTNAGTGTFTKGEDVNYKTVRLIYM